MICTMVKAPSQTIQVNIVVASLLSRSVQHYHSASSTCQMIGGRQVDGAVEAQALKNNTRT